MQRHTNTDLPKSHPFRTVYTGTHNGSTYRVARCTIHAGKWRLDVRALTGWEANVDYNYPTRDAAMAAFKGLGNVSTACPRLYKGDRVATTPGALITGTGVVTRVAPGNGPQRLVSVRFDNGQTAYAFPTEQLRLR